MSYHPINLADFDFSNVVFTKPNNSGFHKICYQEKISKKDIDKFKLFIYCLRHNEIRIPKELLIMIFKKYDVPVYKPLHVQTPTIQLPLGL